MKKTDKGQKSTTNIENRLSQLENENLKLNQMNHNQMKEIICMKDMFLELLSACENVSHVEQHVR